jgi:hypothetical protein
MADFQTNLCRALYARYKKRVSFEPLKLPDGPFRLSDVDFNTLKSVAPDHEFLVYYIRKTYGFFLGKNPIIRDYLLDECPTPDKYLDYIDALVTLDNAKRIIGRMSYKDLCALSLESKFTDIIDNRICQIIRDTPDQITAPVPFKYIKAFAAAHNLDHQYQTYADH